MGVLWRTVEKRISFKNIHKEKFKKNLPLQTKSPACLLLLFKTVGCLNSLLSSVRIRMTFFPPKSVHLSLGQICGQVPSAQGPWKRPFTQDFASKRSSSRSKLIANDCLCLQLEQTTQSFEQLAALLSEACCTV